MIILLLSLVLSASLLHPPLCQRILQSLYEIISFISTLKVVKPTTSQEREELDGEDLPNPPSPLSRQETGLTLRPQPRTSETEDDGESEETIPRHEAVPSHDTEDASATETEDVVTRPDLGKRAKQPARVTGEIQTVVVPSNPSVINFRLNQIGIDLRKQFPDAPLFGRYNDALELPLFIQHLRQKLLWDKEMYPTKQDQIAYALGRLDDEERAYFTEYINEDGSVRLDSLDDFIKILSEKHSKSEKAIDTLKSTISLLQSRLKSKIKEPELKRQGILSDFHVDIWPAFKQLVEDKPPAAIQALSGKPKLYWERSMDDTKPFSVSTEARGPLEVWEEKWKSGREIPERVRINSPGLLRALKDISEGEWAMSEVPDDDYEGLENQSVVFLRPYKFFWHYRENINKKREELEGKVRRLEESRTAAEKARMDAAESEPTSHEKELQEEFHQTRQLLDDVKCLTRFIENAVTPVALKYRDKENIPQKITFSDLWYLFSPGEIAVSRGSTEDDAPVSGREGDRTASQNTSSEPTAWRIFDMTDGRPRLSPGYSDDEYMQTGKIFNSFEIQCYKIDFDGYKMGPTINYFNIAHFEGEREINSLRLVPLRCTKDLEKLQQRFEKIGRKFLSVTKRPYCHQKYVGKKYTHCSNGAECLPAVEGLGSTPKHIQGSVIVDFATAGKEDPKWLSFQGLHDPLVADSTEFTETWSFKVWRVKKKEEHESSKATGEGKADRQAYRCIHREEHIYNDSHIDRSIRLKLVSEDPFLSEFQRGSDDERITVEDFEKKFFKDNKLILAEKVCAYILDRMCFALLAVEGLDEPIKMSRGWDDLQLQSTHQTVIKALVKKHMTKHDQGAAQKSRPTHDLVAGKGEGLIILLHGAPGVSLPNSLTKFLLTRWNSLVKRRLWNV